MVTSGIATSTFETGWSLELPLQVQQFWITIQPLVSNVNKVQLELVSFDFFLEWAFKYWETMTSTDLALYLLHTDLLKSLIPYLDILSI